MEVLFVVLNGMHIFLLPHGVTSFSGTAPARGAPHATWCHEFQWYSTSMWRTACHRRVFGDARLPVYGRCHADSIVLLSYSWVGQPWYGMRRFVVSLEECNAGFAVVPSKLRQA